MLHGFLYSLAICMCVKIGLLLILKTYNYLTTGIYSGKERLDGKTAIVTGANSGLGLAISKNFAKRGARVVMVCRDMKKAERAKEEIIFDTGNINIILKHVDFLSLDSVRRCAEEIIAEESRIDILVNNAGIGTKYLNQTVDGLGNIMQTNYFAPFLFTNMLLGKIKQSAPSRIINVSSIVHAIVSMDMNNLSKSMRKSPFMLYAESKLANIYFSNELANKLRETGVTSNSCHPGVFASDLFRSMNKILNTIIVCAIAVFFKSTEEAAQTIIFLGVSPDVEKITGEYFSDCKLRKQRVSAMDVGVTKKLWDLTEDAVKLQPSEKHY